MLEKNAKLAYDKVLEDFKRIGIECWLMSAKRNYFDQVYAQGETFAFKLSKSAKEIAKQNDETIEGLSNKQKLKIILKNPKLIKLAYSHQKKYAARLGHSEHHSGLAVDIKVDMSNVVIPEKIKQRYPDASQGLLNFNTRRMIMEKHGFIQTYPQSTRIEAVTGMPEPEAWHWRYIGAEHSHRIAYLRECVGQDVFLEDYVRLLEYDVSYENEQDLINQYADILKNEIFVDENIEQLTK